MIAKIVIVGSFNADLTAYMERMPRRGETVHGRKFVVGPGGKGSNQAIAAARLGANVTFVGRIGQDVFATIALNIWGQESVNTDYVIQDPEHATGVAPIFVDDTGENSICVVLGANLAVSKEDVDAAKDVIAQADVMLTQLEIDYDTVGYALKVAKDLDVQTILNPAPAGKISSEYAKLADYLTPNETELEVFSNKPGASIEEAARSLLTTDNQTVIVTLGSRGAQYVQNEESAIVPGYKVEVVDTTGAGDAFNGGLAVALAEGKGLVNAIDFANATAALCVTKTGTASSMPLREEVEAFLISSRPLLS